MKERVLSSYSFEKQPEGIMSEYSLAELIITEKKEADMRKFDPRSVKTKFIGNDGQEHTYIEKKILLFSTKKESIREESVLQSPNLDLENECFNMKKPRRNRSKKKRRNYGNSKRSSKCRRSI